MEENRDQVNIVKENSASFWDAMAKPCSCYERRSAYAEEFLMKSGIADGDTVFDMGCGTGTLCFPLADDGHRVFGGDFSKKALGYLNEVIREEGLDLITTAEFSWEEDWSRRDLPVCDYAFASRCLFDTDPEDAVEKISSRALNRVCITVPIDAGMFQDIMAPYSIGGQEDRTAIWKGIPLPFCFVPERSNALSVFGDVIIFAKIYHCALFVFIRISKENKGLCEF